MTQPIALGGLAGPPDQPVIEVEEQREDYARIVASPLLPGFGITLGNALRRVLLSSLPGAAVTSIRIDGVLHEFSTIPHVKEDTIEFLLNVKELRLRPLSNRPGTLILDISGREGPITAADIQVPEHYEIVNPDLYLMTVDSPEARLYIEFNVEIGRGYVPAGQADSGTVGVIPVDAIFSPVRKVNYNVEHTRVGQATNYDRLTLEIWTDGTISGVEAVSKSAEILAEQFKVFSQMGRPAVPVMGKGIGAGVQLSPEQYSMPIEDLQLSMRAYNCLRRSGLMTVGQVLEKSEEELLALRNFGRKSYDELRDRLDEMGLLPKEPREEILPEAPPLGDEEAPPVLRVQPEAAAEKQPEAPEPSAPVAEAAPPKAPKAKGKGKAAAVPTTEEEEIPEWKRALLALTSESEQEGS